MSHFYDNIFWGPLLEMYENQMTLICIFRVYFICTSMQQAAFWVCVESKDTVQHFKQHINHVTLLWQFCHIHTPPYPSDHIR